MAADLSFTFVNDQAVFLDLATDRYMSMDPALSAVLHRVCEGSSNPVEEAGLREKLVSRRLHLEDSAPIRDAQCIAPQPAQHSWIEENRSLAVVAGATVAFRILAQKRRVRSHSLAAILASLRADRTRLGCGRSSPSAISDVLQAHYSSRLFLPAHGFCLPRSITLARDIAQRHVDCALVFGVTLYPFRAHCWVQLGCVVLNDGTDDVRAFTPILVV